MKKVITLLVILVFALGATMSFANEITLYANDQMIKNDVTVIYRDYKLYGSVSELAKHFGSELIWLEYAQMAVVKIGDDYVSFGVGKAEYWVNNKDKKTLAEPSFIENDKLYVPIDDFMSLYEVETNFEPERLTYEIYSDLFSIEESELTSLAYTDEDLLWLARIVDVETGDATIFKRMAVANVVLNRVKSTRFPNTIKEVIFQSGQFPPSRKESFLTLTPKMTSIIAAKRALEGENNVSTALFFNYIPFKSKANDFYKLIEGDYFYY